jgi:two-component system, cell cycle response regulator
MSTRILIADDDPVSCQLLGAYLRRRDYNVIAVADGIEAQRILQGEDAPNLAILDWMMPGLDGIDVIKQLRSTKQEPYTYILLLTAKGEKQDILQGLDAGADDYLTKPFDAQQLAARLRVGSRILDLQQRLVLALQTSEFRATHDFLTGLYNRGAILDLLRRESSRCTREGLNLSLLIVDADHFKQINDTYGHAVGDEVLKQLSQRMKQTLRTYDLLARYGGEEFLIIASNCDSGTAMAIGERLRNSVATEPLHVGQSKISATLSIGVTSVRGEAPNIGSLLRSADGALYLAKNRGRNRVEFASYTPSENPLHIEPENLADAPIS